MCESIGHRPLRGRCPKGKQNTDRLKRLLVDPLFCDVDVKLDEILGDFLRLAFGEQFGAWIRFRSFALENPDYRLRSHFFGRAVEGNKSTNRGEENKRGSTFLCFGCLLIVSFGFGLVVCFFLFVCLFICLFVCLFVYLFFGLFVCLFVCLCVPACVRT